MIIHQNDTRVDSMVRQWPDDYLGLFIMLSNDEETEKMLQIKSGKKSTGMSFGVLKLL